MTVSIIAAVARNGIIGKGLDLPWHLPADLSRFKRITMGHHLIMGRRTFEAIGRPLPGRTSIVLTRSAVELPGGVGRARSLDEALDLAAGDDEVFIVGGAALFTEALSRADRLYLTRLRAEFDGDVYFPDLDLADWRETAREEHDADARHPCPYTFLTYERA